MTRKVLLDTNLLVAVFDTQASTSQEEREKAKQLLQSILHDDDVALAITPLIRYELLRGVAWTSAEHFDGLVDVLAQFEEFDIDREIAELAADLFRFDKHQSDQEGMVRNLDKRKFDIFHYSSAACNGLELASNDADMEKIKRLHQAYETA